MTIDAKLLDILCCPVSKKPVKLASKKQLQQLNQAITENVLLYVDGKKVTTPLQQGLITDDDQVFYRINDGIPVMLADQGIGMTQLT